MVDSTDIPGPAGTTLRVHDFGGDGPPLILGHATGFHGLLWAPVAQELADFRCYAFDLRGHGGSPAPVDERFEWDGFGRDVSAVLAAMRVSDAVGVGHSLGAVALLMAALAEPAALRQLVLFEPALAADRTEPVGDALLYAEAMIRAAASRRSRFSTRSEALTNFASKRPLSQLQAAVLFGYVKAGFLDCEDGAVELACRPEYEAAIYRQTRSHDTFDRLGEVACPIVLVRGDRTTPVQAQAVEAISAACGAEIVTMAYADHFGPFQQPQQFADIVRAAIAR